MGSDSKLTLHQLTNNLHLTNHLFSLIISSKILDLHYYNSLTKIKIFSFRILIKIWIKLAQYKLNRTSLIFIQVNNSIKYSKHLYSPCLKIKKSRTILKKSKKRSNIHLNYLRNVELPQKSFMESIITRLN